jgi:hypothetical protein
LGIKERPSKVTHEVVQPARMVLVVDDFETIPSLAREFLEAAFSLSSLQEID